MSPEATRCRSCGAPVLWVALTKTGKLAPLDYVPTVEGNIAVEVDTEGRLWGRIVGVEEQMGLRRRGTVLRLSHFATCPQADHWRKDR